jgi:hypothetical protein
MYAMQHREDPEEQKKRRCNAAHYCEDAVYGIHSVVVNIICIGLLLLALCVVVYRIRRLLLRQSFQGLDIPLPTTSPGQKKRPLARPLPKPVVDATAAESSSVEMLPPDPLPLPPPSHGAKFKPPSSPPIAAAAVADGAASEYSLLSLQRFLQQQHSVEDTRTNYE